MTSFCSAACPPWTTTGGTRAGSGARREGHRHRPRETVTITAYDTPGPSRRSSGASPARRTPRRSTSTRRRWRPSRSSARHDRSARMKRLFTTNSTPVRAQQWPGTVPAASATGRPPAAVLGFAAAAVGDRGRRDGIDVSRHQGVVDWKAVKATGARGRPRRPPGHRLGRPDVQAQPGRHGGRRVPPSWPVPLDVPGRAVVAGSASARLASARKQAEHYLATVGQLRSPASSSCSTPRKRASPPTWWSSGAVSSRRPPAVTPPSTPGCSSPAAPSGVGAADVRRPAPAGAGLFTRPRPGPGCLAGGGTPGSGPAPGRSPGHHPVDIDQVDDHAIFDRACGLTTPPPTLWRTS